jgi:hypothetical protein
VSRSKVKPTGRLPTLTKKSLFRYNPGWLWVCMSASVNFSLRPWTSTQNQFSLDHGSIDTIEAIRSVGRPLPETAEVLTP